MTIAPLLYLLRRSQRLLRRHSCFQYVPSRRLHFADPSSYRSNCLWQREHCACSPAGLRQGLCLKMFPLYWKTLAQRIHTQHAEFERHHKSFSSFKTLTKVYNFRPLLVFFRGTYIMAEVTMLSVWHLFLTDTQMRAEKLRRCLIRLGPFYIKLGQALSTRPDVLPSAYCQELAKLQDYRISSEYLKNHDIQLLWILQGSNPPISKFDCFKAY